MAFKSQSQRAKFAEMLQQGKITQSQFDEWNSETPKDIPARVIETKNKIGTIRRVKVK